MKDKKVSIKIAVIVIIVFLILILLFLLLLRYGEEPTLDEYLEVADESTEQFDGSIIESSDKNNIVDNNEELLDVVPKELVEKLANSILSDTKDSYDSFIFKEYDNESKSIFIETSVNDTTTIYEYVLMGDDYIGMIVNR